MVILGFAIGFSAVTLAFCHVVALAFVRQMLAHQRKIDELRAEIDMELARHGLTQDQVLEAIEELHKSRVLLDDRVIYSLWRDDTFQIYQVMKVADAA